MLKIWETICDVVIVKEAKPEHGRSGVQIVVGLGLPNTD